ncbi:uncharacterized protein LOC112622078 [Theropithecus gelada]|uniref:uncharacterized protein LOC112622078 n=1 Tax=Theropithecus gelada TaxID=9565 RepID=UPI000DC1AF39|nr:uncharacterized protein LOC112622078 [Theropithecus gelada]
MDNEIQAEVVSDGDEELIGNWRKNGSCYVLAKRLVAFCPWPKDLWNFELVRDDLGYLVEEISKQQSIQEVTWVLLKAFSFVREAEHKSLENVQPDNVIENKIPFSVEKFKLAAKIRISNEELNINPQNNGKMSPGHVGGLHSSPSHHRAGGLEGKKWFQGLGPGPPCSVQPKDLVPCVPATPAMAKRGQGTICAIGSEGASPRAWQLPHGVDLQVHRS